MKNYSTIWISPVPRQATQGRDKQTFTSFNPKTGEQTDQRKLMHKTREIGTGYRMSFRADMTKNKLHTGLEESVDNPFYNLDASDVMSDFGLDHSWSSELDKIVKQKLIKKQTYFEILDQREPGFYKSEMVSGNLFTYSKNKKATIASTFLEQFYVTLYDGPNRFTDETPRGRIAIQLFKVHDKVAPNKQSINPTMHSFYISEENEAEMEKMRKQDVIDQAIYAKVKLFNEASELKLYQVASLCLNSQSQPIVKGTASKDQVKQAINNYLDSGTNQLTNVGKFIEITDLLKEKENKLKFEVLYLVQQGINMNVLSMKDGYMLWHSKAQTPQYKFSEKDKFVNLILVEMLKYNPEDTETSNWYYDLYSELEKKGVWLK